MITSQVSEFRDAYAADRFPARHAATAKALMLVSPEGFAISGETASDNVYMDLAHGADPERALAQHRELWRALDRTLPITQFKGSASTPDAVFCNNAYATVLGRLIVGAMRHASGGARPSAPTSSTGSRAAWRIPRRGSPPSPASWRS
jgi:hypothetical protein